MFTSMKNCFSFLIVFGFYISNAQEYTRGGASQLYWDWRPDIASNCYEFTYENYVKVNLLPPHYDYKIGIFFWNDCNYGKTYIKDSNCNHLNSPLNDTLYRVTSYYGERDTLCGFNSPYEPGLNFNFAEKTSPIRTKIIYKGLVYLPEKCNRWYFSVAKNFNTNGVDQYYCTNGSWGGDGTYTNKKSNIDSLTFSMRFSQLIQQNSYLALPVYCSFDNSEFSNNSSSRNLSQLPNYFPINKNVNFNYGNFDPDHDSTILSIPDTIKSAEGLATYFSISGGTTFCLRDTAGNPISEILTNNFFFAPLIGQTGPNPIRFNSKNNPFDTDSTFQLIDSTGQITFNAKSDMQPILYVKATEFRNHKFLSETFIINQFTLINENREPSVIHIDTSSMQNVIFNNQGTMMSCIGLPISFNANVILPILGGDLVVRTTADTTLPGNGVCTITGNHTDSVHLSFSWTPPMNARGLYNVFISAKDTNCSPPYNHYLQVFTWSFYIDSCLAPLQFSNVTTTNPISIYPNPSDHKLTIRSNKNFSHIKIFSLLSQMVFESKINSTNVYELSTSEFSKGIYIITIDDKYVKKLVIER